MNISINKLREKVLSTFHENGFSDSDAERTVDYLLWAEMSGNKTQGLIKMTGTEPLQGIKALYSPKVERDTKLSQLIDGGANPAPVVASLGTDIAISKAKEHGFGIVGVRNTFSSNGAQAYYAEKIAENDLIGIVCSRSPASTAGFGSIDPIFGTNPLGYAFPTNKRPFVFDMATSAMTFYGLVLAKAKNETIPENMAIDKNGQPTTDPAEAMSGALLPFDHSYKGSGLAMMVETLAGPLINGAWIDNKTFDKEWGSIFIAIDPNLLIDIVDFKSHATQMIEDILSARTKSESSPIRLPGTHSSDNRLAAESSGFIDVDEVVLRQLGYIE
ncbi:MAG: Ldh family oxidoreductase [Candidatus Microsaccharimonas sp.]